MRGALVVVLFSFQAIAIEPTFVEKCINQPALKEVTVSCSAVSNDPKSVLVMNIVQGEFLKLSATGQFGRGRKHLYLGRVQHLPPQMTDLGVIGESVRFIAKDGLHVATLTFPCNQNDIGLVGLGPVSKKQLPKEYMARCAVVKKP